MGSTVTVNNMTVVHKDSSGISSAFPDVCKTPVPPSPSPIPIPYPNIAMSSDAADTVSSVKADGNPIMVSTSKYSTSSGDEAGSLFGLMSNKTKGSASPQMYSMDVKAEGKNVFRQLDIMLQNGAPKPINTPPGPNNQPPKVAVGKGPDPEKWKIVEVQWSDTKLKCGDMVKIRTKTENYPDGVPIAHIIHKSGEKKIHAMTKGSVSGNSVDIDWLTWNGAWEKAHKKLKAKAHGGGGAKESSNELEIEIPDEVPFESHGKSPNVKPRLIKVPNPSVVARLIRFAGLGGVFPSATNAVIVPVAYDPANAANTSGWGNDYKFLIGIVKGEFWIHCKVKLVDNIEATKHNPNQKRLWRRYLKNLKKEWKKIIEGTWDQTRSPSTAWVEHREKCLRGDKCNCVTGCCIFPIRVKCSFVDSGEHKVVNLQPGVPDPDDPNDDRWWNAGTWFSVLSRREGNPGKLVYAHEFGHNLGMWDEYPNGAVYPQYYDVAGSLMNSGVQIQIQHLNFHPEPGLSIHDWFSGKVKEKHKLLDKKK